jgi:hypothetical protein
MQVENFLPPLLQFIPVSEMPSVSNHSEPVLLFQAAQVVPLHQ